MKKWRLMALTFAMALNVPSPALADDPADTYAVQQCGNGAWQEKGYPDYAVCYDYAINYYYAQAGGGGGGGGVGDLPDYPTGECHARFCYGGSG